MPQGAGSGVGGLLERMLPWLGSFRGQVAAVTGASSGIGQATALAFARQGASVALIARRRGLLEELEGAVVAAGGRALVAPADVTDRDAVRAAVALIASTWGSIDVLVNNAGILVPASVDEIDTHDLDHMFRVNLYGALFMMQAVLPVMRARGRGTIVNVASLAGRRGLSPLGGYCATKFALVGLTEALRTELDGSGIQVGLVLPGVVDTPMAHGSDQHELMSLWPAALNMPAEWVALAVLLAARFGLREISVPPGAATLEVLGALAPGATDLLIGWARSAGRLLARRS